jgi:hypothetical protein
MFILILLSNQLLQILVSLVQVMGDVMKASWSVIKDIKGMGSYA